MNLNILKFKVFTNSSFEKIEWHDDLKFFKIYIHESPEKGKANKKIIEIISKKLKIPKFNIKITSGFTTTIKLIEINFNNKLTEIEIKNILLK